MQKTIVIATHNPGKLIEYRGILKGAPFEILSLSDIQISNEPEENGKTFEENAVFKANFYSRLTDLPLIAEDSGLEIDYLNGEPGVYSRRWPGHRATDQELVDLTLEKLRGVPWEKRGAQFRVVMAFKASSNAEVVTAVGAIRGFITEEPQAKIIPGFPFRSIFYVPELGKTLGGLQPSEEGMIGHRSQAINKLLPILNDL